MDGHVDNPRLPGGLRQVDDILAQVRFVAAVPGSYAPDARQSLSRRDARSPVTPA
ncbi:hypothetical protein [Micromonospora sp. NPDC049891]|uniref:hypothetical protein n=1 Tax=Micromonospora sp. NPDC049891 TaxID=3155655 RepID=UPI0033EF3328